MFVKKKTTITLDAAEVCAVLSEYLNNKYENFDIQPKDIELHTCAYRDCFTGGLRSMFDKVTVVIEESDD